MGDVAKKVLMPAVLVLEEGRFPVNIHLWHSKVKSVLQVLEADYLLMMDWSVVSANRPKESRVAKLLAKKALDSAAAQAAKPADEAKAGVTVKVEPGYVAEHTVGAGAGSASEAVYYRDPMKDGDVPEPAVDRKRRVLASTWLADSLVHHPDLVSAVRQHDVAALVMMVMTTCASKDGVRVLTNIFEMTSLKKLPGEPWSVLCSTVTRLHSEMGQVKDERFKVGSGILPAFLLRALDNDEDYKVEVALLRRQEDVTVEDIVRAASIKSVVAEAGGVQPGGRLTGLGAAPFNRSTTATGVCYGWRDNGKCRFGEKCKFSHQSGGAPKPAPKTSGGCLECGSLSHGFQDCGRRAERLKKASDERTAMVAQMTALKAQVAAMGQADAGPSTEGVVGQLGDVGAEFECSGMDPELAAIWAGKA